MGFRRCYSTVAAAFYVGVTPQLLAAWRKRGVGPGFARLPSGFGRNRAEKAGGVIVYPIEQLADFVDRMTVAAGRLPRPTPGRLPGGKSRTNTYRRVALLPDEDCEP